PGRVRPGRAAPRVRQLDDDRCSGLALKDDVQVRIGLECVGRHAAVDGVDPLLGSPAWRLRAPRRRRYGCELLDTLGAGLLTVQAFRCGVGKRLHLPTLDA